MHVVDISNPYAPFLIASKNYPRPVSDVSFYIKDDIPFIAVTTERYGFEVS